MRAPVRALVLAASCWSLAAVAQESQPAPSFEELQAMIARMQQQVDTLGATAAERDKALDFLSQQVDKAAGQISGTGQDNASLRGKTAVLSDQLEGVSAERDRFAGEAQAREGELGDLRRQLAAIEQALGVERQGKSGLQQALAGAQAELGAARTELESQKRSVAGALEALDKTRAQLAELNGTLQEERRGRQTVADQASAAQLRVRGLESALATVRSFAKEDAERLAAEIRTLRAENEALKGRLAGVESEQQQKSSRIAELDRQLKEALAEQVEELSRYRSEFFGRLRQVLGDRPDIRIVGDRFVFQSELLFASGSATLDAEGSAALGELANSLREVAARIPPDIDWVLRVDGHTDRLPVRYGQFTSNWELSAARAIAVVEFLIRAGIPAQHLAAAGFADHRPLDARDDEIAYRRNRRIEFKLTEG